MTKVKPDYSDIIEYEPARLVEGKSRWYIEYRYRNPSTKLFEYFRPTFNLNRKKIYPTIPKRRKKGKEIVAELNRKLSIGWSPYHGESVMLGKTNVIEAVDIGVELCRANTDSPKSKSNYKTYGKYFCEFLKNQKLDKMYISELRTSHCQRFLDTLVLKKYSNRTYQNYRDFLHTIFERLLKRDYIVVNAWKNTERRELIAPEFVPYEEDEAMRILKEIELMEDWGLLLCVQCCYYGLFRPVEITRLKRRHFDFQNNRILLPPGQVMKKVKKPWVKRIPDKWRNDLWNAIGDLPPDFFIVGNGSLLIHGFKPTHTNQIQKHYREVKKRCGINTTNKRLYTWKEMGIIALLEAGVDVASIQVQAGHTNAKQTLHYTRYVNTGPSESLCLKFPKIGTGF